MLFCSECDVPLEIDNLEILVSSQKKSEKHRLTLEAIYIEIKPSLNTEDEFRNRELSIDVVKREPKGSTSASRDWPLCIL